MSSAVTNSRNITITPRSSVPLDEKMAEWQQDANASECYLCETPFTVITRKHHCRNCGKIICGACSSNKYKFNGDNEERVCDLCYNCSLDKSTTSADCNAYLTKKKLKIQNSEETPKKTKQHLLKEDGFFYVITPGFRRRNNLGQKKQSLDDELKLEDDKTISISLANGKQITGDIFNAIKRDDENSIQLRVTKTNAPTNYPIGTTIIIENVPEDQRVETGLTDITRLTDIQIKKSDTQKPELAYLFSESDQTVGGYKRRQSKSKRKNKRSLRRRVSKRSNVRRKKVTKRFRKMRRRTRR
jgi:hypothetical protein